MSVNPASTLLITGSHGQLGRSLARACAHRGIEFKGRDVDTLDIADTEAVTRWIEAENPRGVINCAAWTAVDDCETGEATAMRVNGTAVGGLATACDAVGARLIQISTDYVFSGNGSRPYREDDPVGPINVYGRSKLLGEELAAGARRHLIVRTGWLYGLGGRNFVESIRHQIESGTQQLRVVADQRGSPTFCDDLTEAILDLVSVDAQGVVHAVNAGETTWHGFAIAIAGILGSDAEIAKVATDEYPRPARRPAFSILDTSRLQALIGRPMPSWEDALKRYLEMSCAS